jgi:uncharacterized protein (DUF433 family)
MPQIEPPDPKAQALLRVIVDAIAAGRIQQGKPGTFLSYSEALELLGKPAPWAHAGSRLQKSGLGTLTEWTIKHRELPKIAALIVNKTTRMPGKGFPEAHGYRADDPKWPQWWLEQANRAINYDWTPFLTSAVRYQSEPDSVAIRVQEGDEGETPAYGDIIVANPPPARIRRSRITVGEVLRWLAAGQSERNILRQHPELKRMDIRACLAYAADQEKRAPKASFTERWAGKFSLPKSDPADARLTYLLTRYERNRK